MWKLLLNLTVPKDVGLMIWYQPQKTDSQSSRPLVLYSSTVLVRYYSTVQYGSDGEDGMD